MQLSQLDTNWSNVTTLRNVKLWLGLKIPATFNNLDTTTTATTTSNNDTKPQPPPTQPEPKPEMCNYFNTKIVVKSWREIRLKEGKQFEYIKVLDYGVATRSNDKTRMKRRNEKIDPVASLILSW